MEPDFKILHVDGDGFFAACEVARRPDLRGRPVVVGEDRGIACAMTYEAKRLGITRAMPIFQIRREFPHVVVLPSHFELYEAYSAKLHAILCAHLDCVEWYSIDECFAEMPESFMRVHGSWDAALSRIKADVQEQIGITCSFGLADTKTLAKVASKLNKPDGCTVLYEEEREGVLSKTPIESVWGIGWKTSEHLRKMGIATAMDFVKSEQGRVSLQFSEPVLAIWHELQATRIRRVHPEHEPKKSLQATRSWSPSNSDSGFIFSELSRNIEIACRRMREQGVAAKSFGVFVRPKMRVMRTRSAQIDLRHYTQNPADLLAEVSKVFGRLCDGRTDCRSTGVSAYGLTSVEHVPEDLFGDQGAKSERDGYLASVDAIRAAHGSGAIMLGSSFRSAMRRKIEQEARDKKDSYVWNLPLPYLGEVT